MTQSLAVLGSMEDVAWKSNVSLAEVWLQVETVIVIDTSGSMEESDGTDTSRYSRAVFELEKLQSKLSGKIAVVGFSGIVKHYPGGIPEFLAESTNLTAALKFVLPFDGASKIILISDGEPDNPQTALAVAAKFTRLSPRMWG